MEQMTKQKRLSESKKIILVVKAVFCFLIIIWLSKCIYTDGVDAYFSYKDYDYQNEFSEFVLADGNQSIDQAFVSKGNVLSNLKLYFGEISDSELSISINDKNGRTLCSKTINVGGYISNSWNGISIDCSKLKRGQVYHITLTGDNLSYVVLSTENTDSKIFGVCAVDGSNSPYTLAMGLTETYRYMGIGYGLQLIVSLLFVAILAGTLCYTILNIERLYTCFIHTEKKTGFLYALYFSVCTAFLFNPIGAARTKATEFTRVMGSAFNNGVDVAKRTSNFSHWFICFATVFVLYFLLANYLRNRKFEGEDQKAVRLLDNVIILANLILGLRCITYFADESSESNIFYYSDFIIAAIIFLAVSYILFGLKNKISVERFEAIIVAGLMIALPISIAMTHDWALGRGFMGVQVIAAILITSLIRLLRIDWNADELGKITSTFAMSFSLIPFCTSLYIESIVWLNQREFFVTHLKRYYFLAVIVGIIVSAALAWISTKRNQEIKNWKTFAYPALIFGFVCLWQQIPISAEKTVDLFETANSSILIGDFLNFGDIPIVEHYGGHMMKGVWEAFIYAVLNNDFAGAVFTPYADYIATIIAVLFFLLVKCVWDEDAALITTLFFPFYNSISYWGLGILVAIAAMAYVRKNSYVRAGLFWLACIWCALYRLDLGFAFIAACITALAIYVVINKNLKALKQLAITLGGWVMVGVAVWCGICIVKGINPINRLLEFLYINLSNQNWAYTSIGDVTLTKFSLVYIFIPFASVVALLYLVLSRKLRKEQGDTKWITIMIFGFSYLYNFSRGLVRHSLAEDALTTCLWSGLFFLSMFFAVLKKNWKLFMPMFALCILTFTLFRSDSNFTEYPIANAAVAHIGDYTETWTLDRFADEDDEAADEEKPKTYWTKLRDDHKVIERVEWSDDLKKTIQGYQIVVDGLLDEDETFVDFINKTSIYPLLNREDPVYVSQSPLQLSGQFTQEEFVKEMEDVPIVLMPYDDEENYYMAEGMDGVPNSYRYYKVAEYIYQNYVPLCTYETQYAVWCLAERYGEFAAKVQQIRNWGTDITSTISAARDLGLHSAELINNAEGSFNVNSTGADSSISELQNVIDTANYIGKNMSMAVEYETDVPGLMQIYYTSDPDENYTTDKIVSYDAQENFGIAKFSIPITEYTRICFVIPDGASVKIKSFKVGICNCDFAEYGYDGPYLQEDGISHSYLPYIHQYDLSKLPLIWAEGDSGNSSGNRVIEELNYRDGLYHYNVNRDEIGNGGNYLKVRATYNGTDQGGEIKPDDETINATIKVGKYINGVFETKYYYTFTVKEGTHDYMFRISNDYYWYIGETDSIQLECDGQLLDVNMQILEGD